jgi:hypothetical protein
MEFQPFLILGIRKGNSKQLGNAANINRIIIIPKTAVTALKGQSVGKKKHARG